MGRSNKDEEVDRGRAGELLQSDLVKKIKRKYGSSIIKAAEEFDVAPGRIPTGSFMLNYALGGGWPSGRVNIAYGDKSSGKTALCLRTIAQAQMCCANCWTKLDEDGDCSCGDYREPVCAYIDVEGTWDEAWALIMGVDTQRLILSIPDHQEQTLDMAELLVRSTELDLLVIDSLAFMTPTKEIEESTKKALQAEQARTLGRGVRKFVSAINYVGNQTGRRPTLLFTNQMRMKIGVMFGDPNVQPGGKAPGFAATTELKCWSGKYEMDEQTGQPLYVDLKFKVDKNKSSGAKVEGEWRLVLNNMEKKAKGDLYDEPLLVERAVTAGFVHKHNNQKWECLGENYRSKSLIVAKMMDEPLFKEEFESQFLGRLLGQTA